MVMASFFEIIARGFFILLSAVISAAIGFIVKNTSQKLVSKNTRLSSIFERISRVTPCWNAAIFTPRALQTVDKAIPSGPLPYPDKIQFRLGNAASFFSHIVIKDRYFPKSEANRSIKISLALTRKNLSEINEIRFWMIKSQAVITAFAEFISAQCPRLTVLAFE